MEIYDRPCPVCGSKDYSNVIASAVYNEARLNSLSFASRKPPDHMRHQMILCPVCDLMFASPAPSMEWLSAQYEKAGFDAGQESIFAAKSYARLLTEIVTLVPDMAGVLDIGAGDGAFLSELLSAGFVNVVGIEPSKEPVAQAREDIKPYLRQGFFENMDLVDNGLSLVTCFQTLEHVENPAMLCSKVFSSLKPGGIFYAVAHDHRALSAKLLGTNSPIFDIEHLQLLSKKSIIELLSRAGFEDINVRPHRNSYPLSYWLRLLPLPKVLKEAVCTWAVGNIIISMNPGNLVVIGKKKEEC